MNFELLGYDDSRTLEKKRREILAAARALFIGNGIDRTSMQMIAEAASITRRSLYNYYESKDYIAVDVQILIMKEVSFFSAWSIMENPASGFKANIKNILENFREEYVFISRFDTYFSNGYPGTKYSDFISVEGGRNLPEGLKSLQSENARKALSLINLLIGYALRIVMRTTKAPLTYSDIEEEVELFCSFLT